MSKINLQEPQRNRNATANFVNLVRTSTVLYFVITCMYVLSACLALSRVFDKNKTENVYHLIMSYEVLYKSQCYPVLLSN